MKALTALCFWLLRFPSTAASSCSMVASNSLEAWTGDCSIELLKENLFPKQGCLYSLPLTDPTDLCAVRSHGQAENLAESLEKCRGAAKEGQEISKLSAHRGGSYMPLAKAKWIQKQ